MLVSAVAGRADDSPYDREPINYSKPPAHDAVAALHAKLTSGKVTLDFDEKHGYLPALLKALNIPASSQTLVFSKTSMQRDYISPQPAAGDVL